MDQRFQKLNDNQVKFIEQLNVSVKFLRMLLEKKVITDEHKDIIQAKESNHAKVDALIDILQRREGSCYDRFCEELRNHNPELADLLTVSSNVQTTIPRPTRTKENAQPLEEDLNCKISQQVRMCYAEIASSVDAENVIDELAAKGVITNEKADEITKLEKRSERMFELIGKLFLGGGHPESFIVFRSALKNYPLLVKMIDETDINLQSVSVTDEERRLNENLKNEVQIHLSDIVTNIDPMGYVLDLLFQEGALQWSEMAELMNLKK